MSKPQVSSGWLHGAGKWITVLLTTAAAVVGLLVNAKSLGLTAWLGAGGLSYADIAARRVLVIPIADTLHAIGDTLHLAAIVTDNRGATLSGANVVWTSDNPSVATVDSSGTVIARGPGKAAVAAAVREYSAHSTVIVWQRVSGVMIAHDSVLRFPEGTTIQLVARAVDERGHPVTGRAVRWESADTGVVTIDRSGTATAVAPGRTTLTASADGFVARIGADVSLTAAAIRLLAGADQRAAVGRRLSQPVVVQATSRSGRPVPDAIVSFAPADGQGSVDPASVATDRNGRARTAWTLGPAAGRQRLLVTVGRVDSTVVVTAEADPVLANTRIQLLMESPRGPAGHPLPEPVGVRVTDSAGAVLADVPVTWSVLDGGSIAALGERTDSLGEARARWTLSPRAESQRARVQVGNPRTLPPRILTASALPGPAAAFTLVSGDAQVGSVGAPLKHAIVARVSDRSGNGVPGVSLTVSPKAGSVADSVVATDSSGAAAVRWTLGRTAGGQRLELRAAGVNAPLRVNARARPLEVANIAIRGVPASAAAGRALPKPVAVTVTDAYGNPLPDVQAIFTVSAGTVTPARVMTDQRGAAGARWTPGSKVGDQTLTAAVRGTAVRTTVTVHATGARSAGGGPPSGTKRRP